MATVDDRASERAGRIVLLLGAPRSGTTWIGKILDSHPDVLYRHEPDTLDRGGDLPKMVPEPDIPAWHAEARAYLLRLAGLARLKTSGKRPLFPKSFRAPVADRLYVAHVNLLRLASAVPGLDALAGSVPVADLAARRPERIVIKSVSGCGCAGLFAAALPEARIVFVIRPPLGQIASLLDGVRRGLMSLWDAMYGLETWPGARRRGLTDAALARLPPAEQLAWYWVLLNEKALGELAGRARVRVLPYRALCDDPPAGARALLAFAGLDWSPATAAFVAASTSFTGPARYFDVRRNLTGTGSRWRAVLTAEDRARIAAVVRQSDLAAYLESDDGAVPVPTPLAALPK